MNYRLPNFASILLTVSLIFLIAACDSNNDDDNDDPSILTGTYELTSIWDKSGDSDLPNALIPTSELVEFQFTEEGVEFTLGIYIEGSLILTSTQYTFQLSVTSEIDQANTENEQSSDTGSYSISGNKMTVTSTAPDSDGPETFTFTESGQTLTLENSETLLTFTKK